MSGTHAVPYSERPVCLCVHGLRFERTQGDNPLRCACDGFIGEAHQFKQMACQRGLPRAQDVRKREGKAVGADFPRRRRGGGSFGQFDNNPDEYILNYMKTITLNVSEPVYADFQRYAQEQDRPTSEILREAMELYRQSKIRPARSLRDLKPSSVGAILRPWSSRGELLEDFLETHDPRD